jgi:hypothetical protein
VIACHVERRPFVLGGDGFAEIDRAMATGTEKRDAVIVGGGCSP